MNYLILLFVSLSVLFIETADARQGCSSHHGGVCGCACCDGTPLSAKCAPYYDCGESKSNYESSAPVENKETETESEDESGETVSFNTNSHKYHCPSCQWAIKCTQNCISVSIEKAKASGGIPCKVMRGNMPVKYHFFLCFF